MPIDRNSSKQKNPIRKRDTSSDSSRSSDGSGLEEEQFYDPIDEPEIHSQLLSPTTSDGTKGESFPKQPAPLIEITKEDIAKLTLGDTDDNNEDGEGESITNINSLSPSSPQSNTSSSRISIIPGGEGTADEPRVSQYQTSHGSIHPLADLNSNISYEPSDDTASVVTMTETQTSSIGPHSVVLSTETAGGEGRAIKRIRVKLRKKTAAEFDRMCLIQELTRTTSPPSSPSTSCSPIYAAKFSFDGNFLAIAGEDGVITIWKLIVDDTMALMTDDKSYTPPRMAAIFQQEPVQTLHGHEGAVLDLCWSRNNFLLSASMDRTVRLWHHSRDDCLGVFRHPDFVTSVAFHPRDDRIFITGSLDCRLRLWSIAEKSVRAWNELPTNNFITAVAFNASGKLALAGTSTGVCLVFETEGFNYSTQIHVHSRRGKNKIGKKICGIEAMPGNAGDEKILISTNDSRIRLYTLRDKSVISKFLGHQNESSQIRAAFSDDGEYVISGSEDNRVFIWNVENRYQRRSFFNRMPSQHIQACECWETHSKPVTVAIFSPSAVRNRLQSVGLRPISAGDAMAEGAIVIAADLNGKVKVYENSTLLESWLSCRS